MLGGSELEIAFATRELRDLCHHELAAEAEIGALAAGALKNRLSDIYASERIREVLTGKPKQSKWKDSECYTFELDEGFVLVLIPNHLAKHVNSDGHVNWSTIQRVKVVYLGQRYE